MVRSDTVRIEDRTFYFKTCPHCNKLNATANPQRQHHWECYQRMKKTTIPKTGWLLMEYLEGFLIPVREVDIKEDLGIYRGQVWKTAKKLIDLDCVERIPKQGYLLTKQGSKALNEWRKSRT
jgi:hypothetical protein